MSLIARCKRPKCFCPAEVPQVPREMLWRLRVLPQVSREMPWRLRESRKSHGKCFGVCGYSRKSRGVCLSVCGYSRKSHGKCFGVCGSPASLAAFALAFAGVPQVPREMLWRLRESRKSKKERFGICRTSAGHFQKRSGYGVASIETLADFILSSNSPQKKGRPTFMETPPLKIDRLRLRYFR